MWTQAQNPLLIAPSCPPAIGSKIDGRYQLTRLLASGSLGLVYEGVDMHTGLEAAVKLFPSWVFQGEARERFLREAKRLGALRHANLVQYLGFGLIGGRSPFLAMERLSGVTLRARLRQVGLLPVRYCLRVLNEVLRGLAAAHDDDVPHRNVRPESVFLDQRGAVLFDFGFSVDEKVHSQLARAGIDPGRLEHLAPCAPAEEGVQLRSDLYGVSAMAYEMLTGRAPFCSRQPRLPGPAEAVEPKVLRPPSELQSPIHPGVDDWVMRGLSEDPGLRFSSAEEMGADCERLCDRLFG